MAILTAEQIHEQIRAYLMDRLPTFSKDVADTEYLENYGLDSTETATLILELEDRYQIEVLDEDLTLEKLGTVASLTNFVQGKLAHPSR